MKKSIFNLNLSLFIAVIAFISTEAFAVVDSTQVTPAQVQSIIGQLQVQKYNTAKTSAALKGKTFVGTLEISADAIKHGAGLFSDGISTKALNKASIFFKCNDFPNGFPINTDKYKITTKITKFTVEDDDEGGSFATITLDQCKSTVAKATTNQSSSAQSPSSQVPMPSQAKIATANKTLDEQFNQRASAECGSGFGGLICHEKLRFAMCTDKWSDNPAAGESTCKGASVK